MLTSASSNLVIERLAAILQETGGWPEYLPPLRQAALYLRAQYPDWVWPTGKTHVVASPLDTSDLFKVFAEPGGCFSPGVCTFGISPWIVVEETLYCPELLESEDHEWRLAEKHLPVITSQCILGGILVSTELVVTGSHDLGMAALFRVELACSDDDPHRGRFFLAVRWIGPAGGLIHQMQYRENENTLMVGKNVAVVASGRPSSARVASLEVDGTDISTLLAPGKARSLLEIEKSDSGIMSAALEYDFSLDPGQKLALEFACPIRGSKVPDYATSFSGARKRECDMWQEAFGNFSIVTPDAAINSVVPAIMTHMRWWMVHGYWRHSPMTYPLYWLRDAALMNNLFDKFSQFSVTRPNADYIAENMYMSGFGAEADAPGQGLWTLAQHYRYTRDNEWLATAWSFAVKKAEMIVEMMTTDRALRRLREPVLPLSLFDPEMDLVCDAARDGLIAGRMDYHRPIIWVNTWALAGLRSIVYLARQLGNASAESKYEAYTDKLQRVLCDYAVQNFGENERDFACAVWPTRAFAPDSPYVRSAFGQRWDRLTARTGQYELETEWTYFDMADAHNRLFMGEHDRAWEILEYYLNHQHAPGMYLWGEGPPPHADRFTTWSRIAGWLDHPTIVPHGWVASEVPLLVRDFFVFEENEMLVFGAGVRGDWLDRRQRVAITGFQTYWGTVSMEINWRGETQKVSLELPDQAPPFELRLPGWKADFVGRVQGTVPTGQTSWLGFPLWRPTQAKVVFERSSGA